MAAHTGVHLQTWSGIGTPDTIETVIQEVCTEAHTFVELYSITGLQFNLQTQLVPISKYGEKLLFTISIMVSGTLA